MGCLYGDRLTCFCKLSDCFGVPIKQCLACDAGVICLQAEMLAPGLGGDLRGQRVHLREARHGRLDRPPRYLAALVEIERRVLLAEDFLDPFLVIQPRDLDL